MEQNLFGLDENGQIIVVEENAEDEVVENGNDVVEDVVEGDISSDQVEDEEISSSSQNTLVYSLGDDALPVVLSDEISTVLVDALTPAGGSLSSNTIDYFDRIVSGLPSDYAYAAYRISSENNTDGILYYSDEYRVEDDVITFLGDNATAVRVERVAGSNYSSNVEYFNYDAFDSAVYLSRSGDVVYYTNATVGFPVLGGRTRPICNSSLLGVALAVALFVSAFTLLVRRLR